MSDDYETHELELAFKAGVASRDAEVAKLRQAALDCDKRWHEEQVKCDQLRNELETERMRNVACGVVAMSDTPDSAKQARNMHPDYMSASCSDVARRVDECIKLRKDVEVLRCERDAARYKQERTVRILTGIHALLYPPRFTDSECRMWQFKSPIVEEQMQKLSDKIRTIPDEIEALATAKRLGV